MFSIMKQMAQKEMGESANSLTIIGLEQICAFPSCVFGRNVIDVMLDQLGMFGSPQAP
jgi:hypothetical protein